MISFSFCPGKFGLPSLLLAAAISAFVPMVGWADGLPAVDGVDPTFGSPQGGTRAYVFGSNFTNASRVQMGGRPVNNFTVNGPSVIVMVTPPGSPGVVDVTVTTPAGTSVPAFGDQFTYAGRPIVTGLSLHGSYFEGGTLIQISGFNFSGATAVSFGGYAVTAFTLNAPSIFTANAPGTITLPVPAENQGLVDVTVTTPGGTSQGTYADQFVYVPPERFGDISCLGTATGPGGLTLGFVIGGVPGIAKRVLLRGIGPGLAAFRTSGPPLSQVQLDLYDGGGSRIDSNFGWAGDPNLAGAFAETGAFALAPGSADAALLTYLLPGAYSIRISPLGNYLGQGIALGEVYDDDPVGPVPVDRIVNLSSLGGVGGSDSLSLGFVVSGDLSKPNKRLLIRAVGPGLQSFGFPAGFLLSNPRLTVYTAGGQIIAAQNDDWGTPVTTGPGQPGASEDAIFQASLTAGAFPLSFGSPDAASIVSLPPGAYSAVVTGQPGATGVALLEVYELP